MTIIPFWVVVMVGNFKVGLVIYETQNYLQPQLKVTKIINPSINMKVTKNPLHSSSLLVPAVCLLDLCN